MAQSANTQKLGRAFVWNTLGSIASALISMVPTMVATRVAGVEAGGVLGLAFGLCYVFGTLATFEVRPFQSIDLKPTFRFSDYYGLRVITCAFMTVLCALYVFGWKYSSDKAQIIFAVCMFKMLDALADVFEGLFQQQEHLEYSGQSMALRMTASAIAYIVVLCTTQNTVWAAWAMPLTSLLCIVTYDFLLARRFAVSLLPAFCRRALLGIVSACFPLFASAFMNMYIANATKTQIDAFVPALQGYWTPLYLPASVINLFSLFVFRPVLTTLQMHWDERKMREFRKLVLLLIGWVALLTLAALLGAYWLGTPVLGLLYGLDLHAYRATLLVVIAGGAFNALSTVFYYIITIMRRQYFLLVGDGITFAAALVITPVFVQRGALMGAALAYLCCMVVRAVCYICIALLHPKRTARS